MTDRRVQFDFTVTFSNGGGIQGQEFRLDIEREVIDDGALAEYIVSDLRLLMVDHVEIHNKTYIDEKHKRTKSHHADGSRLVDLSHPITAGMITYPGLPGPVMSDHMSREDSRAHYEGGTEFHIGRIDMIANTGTYLDSPFHRYEGGADLASLDVDRLLAVRASLVSTGETSIGPEAFENTETCGRAILIHTGWSRHFGTDRYLGGHPHLNEAAAQRLVEGGAKVVGIDSANIDDTTGGKRPAHSVLLEAGIPVVEHLTNLDRLAGANFVEFTALPPPFVGVGTFPVRAVAKLS